MGAIRGGEPEDRPWSGDPPFNPAEAVSVPRADRGPSEARAAQKGGTAPLLNLPSFARGRTLRVLQEWASPRWTPRELKPERAGRDAWRPAYFFFFVPGERSLKWGPGYRDAAFLCSFHGTAPGGS